MKKSSESGGFPPKTRRELADRAGHHCSLCLALTTCSDEGGKPFPIGDAAHQAAASVGGPRYDPNQTKAERSSAKNGLWLCGSCHRKIDGDKYRYTVEDLKQMKERAEDRARRMVHGEIVFEMKDKEHAAIEHYFESRPLKNQLPKSASGAMLGVQIVPYTAIIDRPRLGYSRPGTDSKGVFVEIGQEVSRIDMDATAQLWISYAGMNGIHFGTPDREGRALPGGMIAEDVLKYLLGTRAVFAKHGIRSPRVIVRARLENVQDKILFHSNSDGVPLRERIVETTYAILDQGEESKILEQLWYSVGSSHGLPQAIVKVVQNVSAELSR